MELSKLSGNRPPLKKLPVAPATLDKHDPGLLRDVVERGAGVINAITRIPGSFVSGLAVGGYHGARKGADAEFEIKPESVAKGLVIGNAIQGIAKGAISGYLLLGPAGALVGGVKEVGESGVGLYLFVKGGAAKQMGTLMAHAIDSKVQPGEGGFEGAAHGAMAGSVSGVRAGAATGYQEGRAAASGAIEGLKEVPREFSDAKGVDGPFWRRALSIASGVMSAAFAAPVGLALSVLKGKNTDKTLSTGARLATSAAGGALMGGLAGSFLGPVGIAVGAGVGAVAGLLGPGSTKGFEAKLASSIIRAKADDRDMGSEVGNNRRDLVQKVITGAASGARQGWDSGVSAFRT